ncbi:MAG: HAD hydrolase family protein [Bacteriovoracales bacterium]|nr:HAD hydrolase family protein [Bacteriovoracales bacterium]
MKDLAEVARFHEEKLRPIKLFLTDVDGVLTDGRIYWAGEEVGFGRFFSAYDGHGLRIMKGAGLKLGIISGGHSLGLLERAKTLTVDFVKTGNEDKRQGYLDIVKECGLCDHEVLYIGDEFFDIPLLKRVGFSAAPPHADPEVKAVCDHVTFRPAGLGCVREITDLVRLAQGIDPHVADFSD